MFTNELVVLDGCVCVLFQLIEERYLELVPHKQQLKQPTTTVS